MSHPTEPAGRREVSETGLHLLQMEIVSHFLRGRGAKPFTVPDSPTPPPTSGKDQAEMLASKRRRLELLGIDMGARLVERYMLDRDRLERDLDMVKFICKEFWEQTFQKQIDVLRTNHRGLYVLTDNHFRWLKGVCKDSDGFDGSPEDYVVFPCGMISGALTRLGVKCRVTAELIPTPTSYKVSFNVQVIQN